MLPAGAYDTIRLVSLEVPDIGALSVLVVAEDPLARAGLTALLGGRPGYDVVGPGVPSDQADLSATHGPDVILWDLGMQPDRSISSGMLQAYAAPVLALVPEEAQVAHARAAGASGFLFRSAPAESILAALVAVAQGLIVLDPDLALSSILLDPDNAGTEPLTGREEEVLALMAEGLPNKLIADRLGISENTVKFHVAALLSKLGAHSRTEAVVLAARRGLLMI